MPAVDLRRLNGMMIRGEGVCGLGDLAVSQRGAGANMSVDVAAGSAYVKDDHGSGGGFYLATFSAVENVTITAADGSNPRLDRICLRIRDAYLGDAANDISIVTVNGTPTGGATLLNLSGAAAVPSNHLLLANVLVAAADTSITTSEIDTTISPGVRQHLALVGAMAPIWHSEATGNVTSFDTGAVSGSSIPATFRDLLVLHYLRGDAAVTNAEAILRFNGDSGANYDYHRARWDTAGASLADAYAQTSIAQGIHYAGSSASASRTGQGEITIPDYAKTTFHKTARLHASVFFGTAANNIYSGIASGLWRSTSAITRISIAPASGNFIAGSKVTVFGIG